MNKFFLLYYIMSSNTKKRFNKKKKKKLSKKNNVTLKKKVINNKIKKGGSNNIIEYNHTDLKDASIQVHMAPLKIKPQKGLLVWDTDATPCQNSNPPGIYIHNYGDKSNAALTVGAGDPLHNYYYLENLELNNPAPTNNEIYGCVNGDWNKYINNQNKKHFLVRRKIK